MQVLHDEEQRKLLKAHLLTALALSAVAATLGIAGGVVGRSDACIICVSVAFALLQLLTAIVYVAVKPVQTRVLLGASGLFHLVSLTVLCSIGTYAASLAATTCAQPLGVRLKHDEADPCKTLITCAALLLSSAVFWGGAAVLVLRGRCRHFSPDSVLAAPTEISEL